MADASLLLDIVLSDLRREDITRVQNQISQSLGRAVNLNVQGAGSGKLDEDMRRVGHEAENAGQSVSQLNNILKRYNQNMLKAEMASERVEDQHRSYAKRINVTNRAYGELNAHSARLRQNENKNQKEINETETQMRQLRQEIQRLQKEQHKLQRTHALDPFGKRSGGIRSGLMSEKTGEMLTLRQSFTTMEGIGLRFKSLISGQIGSLMLFSTAIMAVRSAVRAWVGVNVELEKSQANLKTVTVSTSGDIDRSMAMMEDRARELSHVVPLAAAKISESMYYLASGGLKDIEVMNQISGSVILATSALIENKLAAETVTTAYNVWSDAALRGTEIADKFQITIARNQVTGEQLAESFKYVAATGKMVGYSLDEVLAITGALGTLGIRGSMAGTSLNQAFLKISKKQGILRNIGIEVVDSSGKLKKFIDIIDEFRRHYGTTIDAMEQEELGKVLDIRAARGIIPFIENIDTLQESLENMGDAGGASMKAMLEQTYTMTSSWELIKNIFAEIAYKTFPDMRDVLTQISGAYTDRFAEALKTPEGIAGYEKMLQEQLKAGKFTSYFGDVSQIEKYIEMIQKAGLETKKYRNEETLLEKSLAEFADKYYSKTITAMDKVFAVTPPSIKKGFWQRYFGMPDDSAIRPMMMDLEKIFKDVNEELSRTVQIKKEMEGWKPFEAVAPFKVPEITTFDEFYSSFQKRQKEIEKGDIFGVGGVPEMKNALAKSIAGNKKMVFDLEKSRLKYEMKGIKLAGDARAQSMQDIHRVQIKLIDLEEESELRAIKNAIDTKRGEIEKEEKKIIRLGGDPEKAPPDKTISLLRRQKVELLKEHKNNENKYRQKRLEAELDTEQKISDYQKKMIMDNHKIDQQFIQSGWNLKLAMVKKGTEEEFDLRRQMIKSMVKIETTMAKMTSENLTKRLKIITNKANTALKKLEADLKKMREAPEQEQAQSAIQAWKKMYGKITEEEYGQQRQEILKLISDTGKIYIDSSGKMKEAFGKYIDDLRNELAILDNVRFTPGFEFGKLGFDNEAYAKAQQGLLESTHRLDMVKTPETDYDKRLTLQRGYLEDIYQNQKASIEQNIEDETIRTEMLLALDRRFHADRIELQRGYFDRINQGTTDYISSLISTGGEINLEETQDKFLKLMKTKNILDVKMEEFRGTPVYQDFERAIQGVNAEMVILKQRMRDIDKRIYGTEDKVWNWKDSLDDIPHAYSIISRSIQSMNKDMDDTTLKMLDMGEGFANMMVGVGAFGMTANPIMAISGAMMMISAYMRKEDDDREQISKSAYEISKATQSGIRADYGQAQTINVQMSNAIKMDFLVPEGLTQGRQEQIADTLVDEMGRKLQDGGYL